MKKRELKASRARLRAMYDRQSERVLELSRDLRNTREMLQMIQDACPTPSAPIEDPTTDAQRAEPMPKKKTALDYAPLVGHYVEFTRVSEAGEYPDGKARVETHYGYVAEIAAHGDWIRVSFEGGTSMRMNLGFDYEITIRSRTYQEEREMLAKEDPEETVEDAIREASEGLIAKTLPWPESLTPAPGWQVSHTPGCPRCAPAVAEDYRCSETMLGFRCSLVRDHDSRHMASAVVPSDSEVHWH